MHQAVSLKKMDSPHARLLTDMPAERYGILSASGRAPKIGDIVALDQGFAADDGLPMVLAHFPSIGADSLYEARLYESELEELLGGGS